MSDKKSISSDVAVSRTIIMFFELAALSVITVLYVLPFKKHNLQINNYYRYIEYGAMAVTFVLLVLAAINCRIKRGCDKSSKIVTPASLLLLSFLAFAAAVIIPLSANRTLSCKYAVAAYVGVFAVYLSRSFISRVFAFQAAAALIYSALLYSFDVFYVQNITFNDYPAITYAAYTVCVAAFAVIVMLAAFVVFKKSTDFNIGYTAVISGIAVLAIAVRLFYVQYVATIAAAAEVVAIVLFAILERRKKSHKKS